MNRREREGTGVQDAALDPNHVDAVEEGAQRRRRARVDQRGRDVPPEILWLAHRVERHARAVGGLGRHLGCGEFEAAAMNGQEPER